MDCAGKARSAGGDGALALIANRAYLDFSRVARKAGGLWIERSGDMSPQSNPILLVEDDDNDVFFLKYAFESAGITNPVQVAPDGQQAIDYLAGNGQYGDRKRFPLPCLILLDLKLPICMGLDVLRWIQQQPALPIQLCVVLSSSADPGDIGQAYRLGARSFLVKPLSVDKRLEMARAIKTYWLDLNQFA